MQTITALQVTHLTEVVQLIITEVIIWNQIKSFIKQNSTNAKADFTDMPLTVSLSKNGINRTTFIFMLTNTVNVLQRKTTSTPSFQIPFPFRPGKRSTYSTQVLASHGLCSNQAQQLQRVVLFQHIRTYQPAGIWSAYKSPHGYGIINQYSLLEGKRSIFRRVDKSPALWSGIRPFGHKIYPGRSLIRPEHLDNSHTLKITLHRRWPFDGLRASFGSRPSHRAARERAFQVRHRTSLYLEPYP